MLDLDDTDARAVSDATWDICELLLDLHDEGRLDTGFGRIDETVPYHAPCQLRAHGIGLPALDLFALVPGLTAVDLDHDCCGVAGTYGLKKEKYDIAMAVGAPLFEKVQAATDEGATRAICDSETCRWQITAATSTPVVHPVQVLAAAYAAADAAASSTPSTGAAVQ
jgi:glycerol-3-phosphate dehydrogenase subunit C